MKPDSEVLFFFGAVQKTAAYGVRCKQSGKGSKQRRNHHNSGRNVAKRDTYIHTCKSSYVVAVSQLG